MAADERTGVADAVVEELRRRGHEPVLHGALERRRARRLGLGERGRGARRGRGPRRPGNRLLLDRHRRLDRRQQGRRASAPPCARDAETAARRAALERRQRARPVAAHHEPGAARARSSTAGSRAGPARRGRRGERPPPRRDLASLRGPPPRVPPGSGSRLRVAHAGHEQEPAGDDPEHAGPDQGRLRRPPARPSGPVSANETRHRARSTRTSRGSTRGRASPPAPASASACSTPPSRRCSAAKPTKENDAQLPRRARRSRTRPSEPR